MEFLIELLLEFLIQFFGEVLFELGLRSIAAPFRKDASPWLAAIGYAFFGLVVGGISLWLFPDHMVANIKLRLVNLGVTPIASGLCMSLLGSWRAKRGQDLIRIDRFSYGYLFALCLGLVRFYWAA
ncbi:hypothetical protein GCM10027277_40060 [Pseudoduganella ginsengisoli]|uniref:Uncharacterized protein n=1 Tax=Pseudoduganella ginsengisoli TaxID=1462440 RepID=A0A6L6PYX5_9BURK|nr:hypothetical protein [Pseudoduganella ginsengisoli]MTW01922.1 hypothetical protein [Pseudoduganella ginsengisoli]